jgi:hypothetical protein
MFSEPSRPWAAPSTAGPFGFTEQLERPELKAKPRTSKKKADRRCFIDFEPDRMVLIPFPEALRGLPTARSALQKGQMCSPSLPM